MTNETEWPDTPIEVTDETYAEFIEKYPVAVIDCWAPWCGPCRMLGPTIEELAGEYKGKAVFGKLNTDTNRAVPMQHGIMSIPTILFFKDGKLVDTAVGALPKPALANMVNALITG